MKARFEVLGRRAARVAVDLDLIELGAQRFFKAVAQSADARVFFVDRRPRQFGRFSEADDRGDIIGPGPPAALLRPADEERLEARLSIDVKRADAL